MKQKLAKQLTQMQFTDRLTKNLKPKKKPLLTTRKNGHGFAIRFTPNGHRFWTFFYHFEGKKQRMTLDPYPEIDLTKVSELHLIILDSFSLTYW